MKTAPVLLLIFISISCCSLAMAQERATPGKAPAKTPSQSSTKSSAASSQNSAASTQAQSEHASPQQVLKLLDLLQIRDSLQFALDTMKAQMKNGAVEAFREKVPSPTADQLRSVNSIVDEAFAEISMDDLIRDVVPVYQRHLSRSDVQALIAFYTSPVGQKLRREQPAIMRETTQATSANQQQKMERLLAKVELRIQQLAEGEQKK